MNRCKRGWEDWQLGWSYDVHNIQPLYFLISMIKTTYGRGNKGICKKSGPNLHSTEMPKAEEPMLMYLELKLAQLTRRAISEKSIITPM